MFAIQNKKSTKFVTGYMVGSKKLTYDEEPLRCFKTKQIAKFYLTAHCNKNCEVVELCKVKVKGAKKEKKEKKKDVCEI